MGSLVGDVSSSARILPPLDGRGFQVSRAQGPYLWDQEGRRYIDIAMGLGSTMLGHAPAAVTEAAGQALADGPSCAFSHPREAAAAAALTARTPGLDRVVFNNSGSEAVHLACRIARAATGKPRIAKIAGGFDGWFDEITLGNAGSAEAGFHDQHRPRRGATTLLRFNDIADAERLFAEHDDIAAILVEPLQANAGSLVADSGYFQHLQRLARAHGALLIADEVLTGFRTSPGLLSHEQGWQPDLATVGKAIGSGVPIAAVLGREAVMQPLIEGRIPRGGTYSGNPLGCAAVIASMQALAAADYPGLLARGGAFRAALPGLFAQAGLPLATTGMDSLFSLWFAEAPPRSYDEASRLVAPELMQRLHLSLRREGVIMLPSAWGRIYLTLAHDAAVMAELQAAFGRALARLGSARAA